MDAVQVKKLTGFVLGRKLYGHRRRGAPSLFHPISTGRKGRTTNE
ncbi:hypothetical protein ACFH04_14040 [Streptomyces noboritoensis]|uniref:Transposase n=1 Tax=Streptomyces noboritoensis TaxID=67337 RepID=A0ABV6TG92_9ACTN